MANTDLNLVTDRPAIMVPQMSRFTLVEVIEKTLVFCCFSYFAFNIWSHIDTDRLVNLILLMSEGMTAALVLLHRPTDKVSGDIGHWCLAIAISFLPLAIVPATHQGLLPGSVSSAMMIFGFLLSLVSKLYLSRSFGIVPANRGVKRDGPYGLLRHPIYAGYLISYAAFLSAAPCLWNLVVAVLIAAGLCRRILAEESVLFQDAAYRTYADQVRYRLVPGLF